MTATADFGKHTKDGPAATINTLMVVDRTSSMVEIAGRRFPAVALICPPPPTEEDVSEYDRSLGLASADDSVYIPAENGLLLRVEEARNEHRHGLSLDLWARSCEISRFTVDQLWLPWRIRWDKGTFVHGQSNWWIWAEPDWVVETIDRLSRKPFTQPQGPSVRLVRLNYDAGSSDA